ncbi:MAG: Yip1 family protein [Elusimicrobia bacterium]|nr:Yip1 family protein [Elusimicrobiota bacterium]
MELVECAARLPITPHAILERCRQGEPPPTKILLGHALAWTVVSFVIRTGLAVGGVTPALGTLTIGRLVLAAVGGLVLTAVGLFVSAALVHGIAFVSGGTGRYPRALQIVSLLAPVGTFAAALSPVRTLWWAPSTLGAYLLARCIAGLYAAPIMQAGIVIAALGVVGLFGQYQLERVRDAVQPLEAAATMSAAASQAMRTASQNMTPEQAAVLRQIQAAGAAAAGNPGLPGTPGASSALFQRPAAGQGGGLPQPPAGFSAAGPPTSAGVPPGLENFMPMMPPVGSKPTPEQQAAIRQAAGAAMQKMQDTLDDPRMTQGMTPAQKRQFDSLKKATAPMMRVNNGGPAPTAAERRQLSDQLQRALRSAMQQGQGKSAPPPQPAQDQ